MGVAHAVSWRAVHRRPPGRQRGNDKVVIVITDGANIYVPGWNDGYGYLDSAKLGKGDSRIFQGTTLDKSDTSYVNGGAALDQHFVALCNNVKAPISSTGSKQHITVMTVALDLD